MKETPKILFRIVLVVFSYLLIMILFSWSSGAKPYNENKEVRPYYGEIEQAENDFVNSELNKEQEQAEKIKFETEMNKLNDK